MQNIALLLLTFYALQCHASVIRRQTTPPPPPTTGPCATPCLAFANYLSQTCSTTATTGTIACLCTTQYFSTLQSCYQCLVEVAPTVYSLSDLQASIQTTETACEAANFPVSSIVLTTGAASTPAGSSNTASANNASKTASGSNTAAGSASSPTTSKSSATALLSTNNFGFATVLSSISFTFGMAWVLL